MAEMSMKKAAFINAGSKYIAIIINLLFSIILSRILSPEDYGIIAVTTVFTTLFTVLANLGAGPAVIQNKTLSKQDINSIYTFTFLVSIALAVIFIGCSFPISWFYSDNVYIPICSLLSVALFFNMANVIPNAMLLRNMRFLTYGIRTIVAALVSGIAGFLAAWFGMKYYALVVQNIVFAAITYFWNVADAGLKLTRKITKKSLKKIMSFSLFQFGFNIIIYFSKNLDNLLIGRFIGYDDLGYYNKAYNLALYPENMLTQAISPVLHPILSQHQEDRDYIYEKYMYVVKLLSLMGLAAGVVFFFVSDEAVRFVFGEKWGAAVPCLQMLSVAVWPQVINASSNSIFQSLDSTKQMFITGLITVGTTLLAIVLGLFTGDIIVIARNVMIANILNFAITYFVLIKIVMKKKISGFLKSFIPEVIIALICIAAGIGAMFIKMDNLLVLMCIKLIILGAAYMLGLIITRQHKILVPMLFKKKGSKN